MPPPPTEQTPRGGLVWTAACVAACLAASAAGARSQTAAGAAAAATGAQTAAPSPAAAAGSGPQAPAAAQAPAALHAGGLTFADFLERARARREEWRQRYSEAAVPAELVSRMRALPGRRLILVVAEDWCSDSVRTVPYIARLVDAAPARLSLRLVNSTDGRAVMEANRTPDGRAATPTVVVMAEDGRAIGAWVERPSTAQRWFLEQQKTTLQQPLHEQLLAWYDEDAGRTTMAEIAAILER